MQVSCAEHPLTPDKASHEAVRDGVALEQACRWLTGWGYGPGPMPPAIGHGGATRGEVGAFAEALLIYRAYRKATAQGHELDLPGRVWARLEDFVQRGLERQEGTRLDRRGRAFARELSEFLPEKVIICQTCAVVIRPQRRGATCRDCQKAGPLDFDSQAARTATLVKVGSWGNPRDLRTVFYLKACAGCGAEFWARRHQAACRPACRQRALRSRRAAFL